MSKVSALLCLFGLFHCCLSAQPALGEGCLQLKIQPLSNNAWGVYAKPGDGVAPTSNTITGSGQVTVVMPIGTSISGKVNHAGTWFGDAVVNAPAEAPNKTYISFGLAVDFPPIVYQPGEEVMLFSFVASGNGNTPLHLIENGDPLFSPPNSVSVNAGNDLGVFDFGVTPAAVYSFCCNYYADGTASTFCSGENPVDTTDTGNPGDTTIVDTTGTGNPGDTSIVDTTGTGNPGDTTIVDTTDTGNPIDTSLVDTSLVDTSAVTGAFEVGLKKVYFTLSPNPAHDWAQVYFEKQTTESQGVIRLWSPQGRLIFQGKDTVQRIDLKALPPGVYLVTFEYQGKVLQRERLVKT